MELPAREETEREGQYCCDMEEGAPRPLPVRTFTILEAVPDPVAHIFVFLSPHCETLRTFSSCEDKDSDAFYSVLVVALKHNREKQR